MHTVDAIIDIILAANLNLIHDTPTGVIASSPLKIRYLTLDQSWRESAFGKMIQSRELL